MSEPPVAADAAPPVVVVGASGTIGRAVTRLLEADHRVVGLSRGTVPALDLNDPDSIDQALDMLGPVRAVICAGAHGPLTPVPDVTADVYLAALRAKLLGQLHLVHVALRHLTPGGSITLTTGRFDHATPGAAVGASINDAVETYVRLAAAELPHGIRINVVSPGWLSETLRAMGLPADDGMPAADAAELYRTAVTGSVTGTVITG